LEETPRRSRSILIAEFPEHHAAPNSGLHQTLSTSTRSAVKNFVAYLKPFPDYSGAK